jgi:Golgi phosphoprotein 3 GPP34
MFSLAEDLLLLLLDDESGKSVVDGSRRDHAIAGAVLVDLARLGRVSPAEAGDDAKKGYAVVRGSGTTGDPVLDAALAKLAEKPVKMDRAVELFAKNSTDAVLDRLVERGLVRREETKLLGFKRKSWPAVDVEHEGEVRRQIDAAVLRGEQPDERTGCLITLLHVTDAITKVVDGDKSKVKARAKEIAESDWASDAVKKAISNANLVMITTISAAT